MPTNAIYLDYAAATPLDERVLAAMQPYLTTDFYNPSATYSGARQTRGTLEQARTQVAACLGARPSEIVFTAGGTEANNLALHGVMRRFPEATLLLSAVEHSAVLAPAAEYNYGLVQVSADGRLDLDDLANQLTDDVVLVSCMYANNEIGTIQPVRDIGRLLETIRKDRLRVGNKTPLYFHVDACQAANYLDIQVARLGADLVSLNGSKIYGPKQTGVLYVKGGTQLTPLISGGGQERGLRSGTENLAGIVGFATALQIATEQRHDEGERLQELQKYWYKQLALKVPTAVINGSLAHRLPNNIHLTIPGIDNERLLMQLDEAGIMAAAGSACSASSQKPSTVLAALGLDDAAARSSLRLTMGRGTTEAEIDTTLDALQRFTSDH
ncbi:cysteine desulfurase [Polaromonas sp.]|nr:cysteine desulfurase [Candidatus Saccharibacteria bacterium]